MAGDMRPLLPKGLDDGKKGSALIAFLTFFKSMFGCGVLSLPHAFQQSGLEAGIIVYIVMGVVCTYTMNVIIKCKRMLNKSHPHLVTFGDVAGVVLGKWGKRFIDFGVVFLELMFNTGFTIVMSSTLHTLVPSVAQNTWICILTPAEIVLSFIRWLKDYWWLSTFGLVVYLFGVMGLTYVDGVIQLHDDTHREPYKSVIWDTLPLFMGTAMYSLEGILMGLPVAASLIDEDQAYNVISLGMAGITIFFCAFGAFGYAAGFGDCGIILCCLPDDEYTKAVKVCLVLSLLVSSPVQIFVCSESLEPMLERRDEEGRSVDPPLWKVYILRTVLVCVSSLVAVVVPNFSQFTDLVGNLLQPIMGFIIPPLFYLLIRQTQAAGADDGKDEHQREHQREHQSQFAEKQQKTQTKQLKPPLIGCDMMSWLNVAVILLGIFALVLGAHVFLLHIYLAMIR
jgi:proton-coupled amino acid transporter